MNLDQIETKCFILALFIRDDGERFLLGSRAYEFVDSQLHFAANSYQNDVVEVQGNDGLMLAGQVRRGTSQAFDGYIGDQTVDRSTIEQYRRDFMKFFRKNHYYKVVYVFPDGSAVQRRNGFIVEAPEVKELYQLFPQYHISMNFEDINYYNYEEDSEGEEIYGESATLKIATSATGGLIWADNEQETVTEEGTDFTIQNTSSGTTLSSVQLKGDTFQQTYSGKNLFDTSAPIVTQFGNGDITKIVIADGLRLTVGRAISGNPYAAAVFIIGNTSDYVGKTITFTCETVSSSTNNSRVYIGTCDSNGGSRVLKVNGSSLSSYDLSWTVEQDNNQYICIVLYATATQPVSVGDYMDYLYPQLEIGTATSYEPYVGGIAAPNPDYPQEVKTATGRQVVTISDGTESQEYEVNLGKNLFDKDNANVLNAYIDGTTTEIVSNSSHRTIYIPCEPNTTYSLQKISTNRARNVATFESIPTIGAIGTRLDSLPATTAGTISSVTVTTPSNAHFLAINVYFSSQDSAYTFEQVLDTVQIELGSTVSSYASYFEPIELCKIGDYQDRIYKSGDDWYLHKEINKMSPNGSESWQIFESSSSVNAFYIENTGGVRGSSSSNPILSNRFISRFESSAGSIILSGNVSFIGRILAYTNTSDFPDLATWKTWLGSNPTTIYYALATPTDTQITNTALITQLNALAAATTYSGQTVFTVSSENQLAILRVAVLAGLGGGVVWDEYGATWEEGTGGGPTMISVESIDNVYPVWELTGPAINPQISVLTTNTTLSYSGTVTASQTLKIDMFNKTATLNGTSVVGNVSGDWVYLAPGTNRVTYTTGNADAPDSTIWWQEIVG